MNIYKRPPITEAVIEIRFCEPISTGLVEKVQKRFLTKYSSSENQSMKELLIDATLESIKSRDVMVGYRLSTPDRTDVVIVNTSSFVVARLSPYLGWDKLITSLKENWQIWKRIVGYKKIQRVGLRYINRIDIPTSVGIAVNLEDYLKFYPAKPDNDFPSMTHYVMQAIFPVGKDDCNVMLNSASIPSPLLNHASFILDLDVSREVDLPQKDDGIWELLNKMREHKNNIFESCITDKSRELFQSE